MAKQTAKSDGIAKSEGLAKSVVPQQVIVSTPTEVLPDGIKVGTVVPIASIGASTDSSEVKHKEVSTSASTTVGNGILDTSKTIKVTGNYGIAKGLAGEFCPDITGIVTVTANKDGVSLEVDSLWSRSSAQRVRLWLSSDDFAKIVGLING